MSVFLRMENGSFRNMLDRIGPSIDPRISTQVRLRSQLLLGANLSKGKKDIYCTNLCTFSHFFMKSLLAWRFLFLFYYFFCYKPSSNINTSFTVVDVSETQDYWVLHFVGLAFYSCYQRRLYRVPLFMNMRLNLLDNTLS